MAQVAEEPKEWKFDEEQYIKMCVALENFNEPEVNRLGHLVFKNLDRDDSNCLEEKEILDFAKVIADDHEAVCLEIMEDINVTRRDGLITINEWMNFFYEQAVKDAARDSTPERAKDFKWTAIDVEIRLKIDESDEDEFL
jgi:DNA repair exonuclease SbcCD nuclease subunit